MKNVLILGLGLLGIGCALETGTPDAVEDMGSVDEAVVTRAKTVSFLPARICDAHKSDIDSWNWSCFSNFSHTKACTEALQFQLKKAPIKKYVGTGDSIYFAPGGGQSWYSVDDEIFVANLDGISCYNVNQSNESPIISFREGLGPKRKVLSIETYFEHIQSVTVRAIADIGFLTGADAAYSDTVEVAVQTLDSDGAWTDKAVRSSEYAYFDRDKTAWKGKPRQILTVSTKVPANEPVRMLIRAGKGAVSGSDVSFSVHDAELRGEECVPNNNGGCL